MIEKIIKKNGSIEAFSPKKVNGWSEWASKTLGGAVDWASVVIEAVNNCQKECTSIELQNQLIKSCLNRKSWEYNKMAGRLYAALIYREIYNEGIPTVKALHKTLFDCGLMVKLNYSDEEYAKVEKIIDHKMDLKYPHYQLNQIRFKYAIRNKVTKTEYESAQFVYMRMAMALGENEKVDKMYHVKKWYEHLSQNRINAPTPNFVNLGTKLNGFASCFPAGTGVDTKNGIKPIEHIAIGDVVLGKSGKWMDVVATTSRNYTGELYGFSTALIYNNLVKSTADHRFMVQKNGDDNIDWVEANDIKVGDFIFHPLNQSKEREIFVWDIAQKRLIELNYSCVDNIIGRINICDNAGDFSKKHKTCNNVQLFNNPDWYRMLGYFFAEGHISYSKTDNRSTVGFTFNMNETLYINDVCDTLSNMFGVYVGIKDDSDNDSCIRLTISSRPISEIFEFFCGRGSSNKMDSSGVLIESNIESLQQLYVGYIRGDGCAIKTGYSVSSVSRNLIDFFKNVSLKLGFSVGLHTALKTNGYPNARQTYTLQNSIDFGDPIISMVNKNSEQIIKRGTRGKKTFTKHIAGGVLTRVNKIHTESFSGIVYDFEVNDDHSFTVNGMCVHNCCLYTTDDTAASLAAGDHIAYMMTVASAGIGTHIKTRSLGDPVRGGVIQHQGKLPYYRAMVGAIGANLQNGRGGASTVYYSAYDPEVEVLQKLRHPMTPANKKVSGCHYSFGSNKLFARKVARNEDFAPFSYYDNEEMFEAQYDKDQTKFETMYSEYEKTAKVKLNAREIALNALTQSYETGVHYLHLTDAMNKHTPFKDKIYLSNLCLRGNTDISIENNGLYENINIDDFVTKYEMGFYSTPKVKTLKDGEIIYSDISAAAKTGVSLTLIRIETESGKVVECTEDHQIYTKNRGWVKAKDLIEIDELEEC